MRKSVWCFCLVCGIVGFLATGSVVNASLKYARATFAVKAVDVLRFDEGTWESAYNGTPLTDELFDADVTGGLQEGDFILVKVFVHDWDSDSTEGRCWLHRDNAIYDYGFCDQAWSGEEGSSSDPCKFKHCQGLKDRERCDDDDDCGAAYGPCVHDTCDPWPNVGQFQWTLDADASLWNGGVNPGMAIAAVPCGYEDGDCYCSWDQTCYDHWDLSNSFCTCDSSECIDDVSCGRESSVYIDKADDDFMFRGVNILAVVFPGDETNESVEVGSGIMPGAAPVTMPYGADESELYYLGAMLLEVKEGNCGTFEVQLRFDNQLQTTYMQTDEGRHSVYYQDPLVGGHESLMVYFGGDQCTGVTCDPPDDPDCFVALCDPCTGQCHEESIVECGPGTVCLGGDCVDDCSMTDVVSIFPPNCEVDARQPHGINDNTLADGWDKFVLTMLCDPHVMEDEIEKVDFSISTAPAELIPPAIDSIEADANYNTITVRLDRSITADHWTCLKHIATDQEWCMGYLPGDADNSGVTNAADIQGLIDSLNGPPGTQVEYHTDINRSGAWNAADILRVIDLINGAGEFEVWNARSMSRTLCPSR